MDNQKNKWEIKGDVLNKLKYPHSYLVEIDKGIKIRCNQCHLLKTSKKVLINPDVDYKDIILLERIYQPFILNILNADGQAGIWKLSSLIVQPKMADKSSFPNEKSDCLVFWFFFPVHLLYWGLLW